MNKNYVTVSVLQDDYSRIVETVIYSRKLKDTVLGPADIRRPVVSPTSLL